MRGPPENAAPARATALLVAGGRGERFGGGAPKQFVLLAGRPLLAHAASVLAASPLVERLVVVVPAGSEPRAREIVAACGVRVPFEIVAGGATRQESVWNGLQAVGDAAWVVVHDAARPFVRAEMIRDALAAARRTGAATVAMPVTDTLVRSALDTECLGTLVDRAGVWSVQTPQAFDTALLRAAHEQARARAHVGTDDGGLVAALGRDVALVRGSWWNLKITEPEDLRHAETLAALRDRLEATS